MAKRFGKHTHSHLKIRKIRKVRIWKRIKLQQGKVARLVVFRSNRFLYVQVVDDLKGLTLTQATTQEKVFDSLKSKKNKEAAKKLGGIIGQRAMEKKIDRVLFDRNGYDYHGCVKEIAEGARETGLRF